MMYTRPENGSFETIVSPTGRSHSVHMIHEFVMAPSSNCIDEHRDHSEFNESNMI